MTIIFNPPGTSYIASEFQRNSLTDSPDIQTMIVMMADMIVERSKA